MTEPTNKSLVLYAEELSIIESLMDAAIDPETGEFVGVDFDTYNTHLELQTGISIKAESLARVVVNLDGEAKKFDDEIKRLTRIKKTIENLKTELKEYALFCMTLLGVKSMGNKPFSINRQRNGQPAVIVPPDTDLSTWEDKFKRVTIEPNKAAIIAAWKAGEPIPANVEIEEGEHIRVR